MEFRLTYSGPLHTYGSPEEKQRIRLHFHPQLTELWLTHPGLTQLQGRWQKESLAKVGAWQFQPLVTSRWRLHCRLNILFLRPGLPGKLISKGGDIDNRIKTLFDALRIPALGELPKPNDPPWKGVTCCLLENDSLISGFDVETDQLLGGEAGGGPPMPDSCVQLVIHVAVKSALSLSGLGLAVWS
jgi:hypothetical protein